MSSCTEISIQIPDEYYMLFFNSSGMITYKVTFGPVLVIMEVVAPALELIGGEVFHLLSMTVTQAVERKTVFQSLLIEMKATLISLRSQSDVIGEIRELNIELGFQYHDITSLETEMTKGRELIERLELMTFHFWNFCCNNVYADQLNHLNGSLRRLLESLRWQRDRDVMEILRLCRQIRENHDKDRKDLDEIKALLRKTDQQNQILMMQNQILMKHLPEQIAGDNLMETLTSGTASNTGNEAKGDEEGSCQVPEGSVQKTTDEINAVSVSTKYVEDTSASAQEVAAKAVNRRYEGLVMVRTKAIKGRGAWYWAHLEPILVHNTDTGLAKAVKLRCTLCEAIFSGSNPSLTASEHLKRGTCPNFNSVAKPVSSPSLPISAPPPAHHNHWKRSSSSASGSAPTSLYSVQPHSTQGSAVVQRQIEIKGASWASKTPSSPTCISTRSTTKQSYLFPKSASSLHNQNHIDLPLGKKGKMNPAPPPPPPPHPQPTTPKKEVQLHGPRPAPLRVSKDSHKITKPPPHPHLLRGQNPRPTTQFHQFQPPQQPHQPVVIYTVSPKVIHTSVNEFMSLVQRLTGPSSSPPGDLSPAARLASIEKISPSSDQKHFPAANTSTATTTIDDDFLDSIQEGIDLMDQFPGILSPAPTTMPPIPSRFFSPAAEDPQNFNWQGVASGNNLNFMASPSSNSALFSTPLVSPSPSSWDLFNNFMDF
ncbi:hypothetical protein M0R45_004380 [Rubus argutus]|uniref:Uncharacterized protein n=1 Tax=Rubus argutus TaxID=59490 RepID=A0AAW1YJQ3_RUBAR